MLLLLLLLLQRLKTANKFTFKACCSCTCNIHELPPIADLYRGIVSESALQTANSNTTGI